MRGKQNDFARELQGKKPPSPEVIIDILSKEYGWTLTEIKNLTTQEVQDYLDIISLRKKLENGK